MNLKDRKPREWWYGLTERQFMATYLLSPYKVDPICKDIGHGEHIEKCFRYSLEEKRRAFTHMAERFPDSEFAFREKAQRLALRVDDPVDFEKQMRLHHRILLDRIRKDLKPNQPRGWEP